MNEEKYCSLCRRRISVVVHLPYEMDYNESEVEEGLDRNY